MLGMCISMVCVIHCLHISIADNIHFTEWQKILAVSTVLVPVTVK